MTLTHTFPAVKKPKKGDKKGIDCCDYEDSLWERRVHLPVSKEILEALEVGTEVSIVLTGKVEGLEMRMHEERKEKNEVTLMVDKISTDESNEFAEMAEDD